MAINIEVISVNVSREKGTVKVPIKEIVLNSKGVEGDAHAGEWHRQVSLLGEESFERFVTQAGRKAAYGEFAENITTKGLELKDTHPGDRLVGDTVTLEITQIGKKCHGDGCAIFREVGNCVMPKEGIFAKVIKGGVLRAGDMFCYQPQSDGE